MHVHMPMQQLARLDVGKTFLKVCSVYHFPKTGAIETKSAPIVMVQTLVNSPYNPINWQK